MGVKILRSKKVKIRKNHECWNCRKLIKKGVEMKKDTIIIDGQILNAYWCIDICL